MGATAQGRGHGGATSGSICPQGCRAYRGDVFLLLRCLWGGMRRCAPVTALDRASPDAAIHGQAENVCRYPSLGGHRRMLRCPQACGAYGMLSLTAVSIGRHAEDVSPRHYTGQGIAGCRGACGHAGLITGCRHCCRDVCRWRPVKACPAVPAGQGIAGCCSGCRHAGFITGCWHCCCGACLWKACAAAPALGRAPTATPAVADGHKVPAVGHAVLRTAVHWAFCVSRRLRTAAHRGAPIAACLAQGAPLRRDGCKLLPAGPLSRALASPCGAMAGKHPATPGGQS